MWQVLTDPDEFFRRRVVDPPLSDPFLVVLFAGVADGLSSFLFYQRALSVGPEQSGPFVLVVSLLQVLISILVALAKWGVVTSVAHLLAVVVFGGRGAFRTVLAAVGYGFLPSVLAGLVQAAGMWVALQSVPLPDGVEGIPQFATAVSRTDPLVVAKVVAIILLLWQGYIWTYGVKHSRHVTLRGAALSTAVPVGLLVLFRVQSLPGIVG